MAEVVQAPPRGTRPRNRRQLIIAAATLLFARDGYPHVSMSQIAEAVGVQPSALYRHFRGKDQLLYETTRHALTAVRTAIEQDVQAGTETPNALIRAVLDHRWSGVLWQRESRHLPPAMRAELRHQLVAMKDGVAAIVARRLPALGEFQETLLAWASMTALMSVSFQRIALPREEYELLLAAVVDDVLHTKLPDPAMASPLERPAIPTDRRAAILAVATELFARRGFHTVGIDEVGAASGIAGPSVYSHFNGKLDLLVGVMLDGADRLMRRMREVMTDSDGPEMQLSRLIASYTEFSFVRRDVMDLLVAETAHLPDPERETVRNAQREYVRAWVRLVQTLRPELPGGHARVRVQAAMNVVNDVARTTRLSAQPSTPAAMCAISRSILGLPPTDQPT